MGVSVVLYLALLCAVGLERFVELRISARNRRALAAAGLAPVPDPAFPGMVALHVLVPVAAALEVVLGHRPLLAPLAITAGALFLCSQVLRWRVIRTLGAQWNVGVVDSARLGVASDGPYRVVRHPNYVAVFVEMLTLPLIHGAWITALSSAPLHALLLRRRVAVEDAVLLANPAYRAAMGAKPLFIPGWQNLLLRGRPAVRAILPPND
jgi:methyltransferase